MVRADLGAGLLPLQLPHRGRQPVYRDALHDYAQSFRRGRPKDGVAHFEETVLAASPLSPVQSIDQLNAIWRRWLLELRDRYNGKTSGGDELRTWGLAALERGDEKAALEFFTEALEQDADPETLEQVFALHEKLRRGPCA